MFELPTLIGFLLPIIIGYISVLFPLKKTIDDLTIAMKSNQNDNVNSENSLKLKKHKKSKKILTLIFIALVSIVILLYLWPTIQNMNIDGNVFIEILKCLQKIVPFKEGFFSDSNFTFSYITGVIFSVIIEFFVLGALISSFDFCFKYQYVLTIIIPIICALGLIWLNNFISLSLSYSIIHNFEVLSIIFNLLIYFLIFILLIIVFTNIAEKLNC